MEFKKIRFSMMSFEDTMKKSVFVFFFSVLFSNLFFSQDFSSLDVNRKTSVRCLKLAESFLASKDYGNALMQAEAGLSYDSSVADLWYIKAFSSFALGETKHEVLNLLSKAFTNGQWVDYNRDNARILYADLLCDTGKCVQSLNILDAKPFLYSADSEFIRLKAYYKMKDKESVLKAREKVDSARKIYPDDKRFAKLFFQHEYNLRRLNLFQEQSDVEYVLKIASSFISKVPEYDFPDAELEIYAAIFSSGEKQKRLLQAFVAHGLSHPLYSVCALKANLISQKEAFDYFTAFADESVSLSLLNDLISLFTEESVLQDVKNYFNSYSGTFFVDIDENLENNLKIKYSRGRSETLEYDIENDGIIDISSTFDFGVPLEVKFSNKMILTYADYSYVSKIKIFDFLENPEVEFYFMDSSFLCTPFDILSLEILKNKVSLDFFVPFIKKNFILPSKEDVLSNVSKIVIPSQERENAFILLTVLDSKIESAVYTQDDFPYAYAVFEDNGAVSRKIDNDGDGVCEVTEIYDLVPPYSEYTKNQDDIIKKLSGNFLLGTPLYQKMVQIDSNADTVPDFSEEYLLNGDKITLWDRDSDGKWDIRYKKMNDFSSGSIIEESSFYRKTDNVLVTVRLENFIPVKIFEGDLLEKDVFQGKYENFFWISQKGSLSDEKFIMENVSALLTQGKTETVQIGENRFIVVSVLGKIFCETVFENKVDLSSEEKSED